MSFQPRIKYGGTQAEIQEKLKTRDPCFHRNDKLFGFKNVILHLHNLKGIIRSSLEYAPIIILRLQYNPFFEFWKY
jgi:hypothetical protein